MELGDAGVGGTEIVGGVDGCRTGWVLAVVEGDERTPSVELVSGFDAVAAMVLDGRVSRVAVDMPIGLSDSGPRRCDVEARRLAGPRRASVFPAPARSVLDTSSYADALVRSRASIGVGLSRQSFNLIPKIREVDAVAPSLGAHRLAEVHPELGFAALAGAPLTEPKRTAAGIERRVELLGQVFDGVAQLVVERPRGAGADDVVDALVLAWAARRWSTGAVTELGGDVDALGLAMRVLVPQVVRR